MLETRANIIIYHYNEYHLSLLISVMNLNTLKNTSNNRYSG
jgi:hypothetical protein